MSGWIRSRPSKLPLRPNCVTARTFPTASSGTSRTSFPDWTAWQAAYDELDVEDRTVRGVAGHAGRRCRTTCSPRFRLRDDIGQLEYKVWYFAALWYDQDQRDNQINAKRQQVQILFAKAAQASAWFDPELLTIPARRGAQPGSRQHPDLAVYRFAIEDLYRQQEHVLDDKGERLLSLASRFESTPNDAYAALSTADVRFPNDRVERRGGHADLRPVPRDSVDEPQPGGSRRWRSASSTSCTRPTPTPTRRSTTACSSATGSSPRPAAIAPRSTWRCTATTFRPRSSKT